jgi:hypothetical protein
VCDYNLPTFFGFIFPHFTLLKLLATPVAFIDATEWQLCRCARRLAEWLVGKSDMLSMFVASKWSAAAA